MKEYSSKENNQQEQMTCTCNHPLAMVSIACQKWITTYDTSTALKEGTIFPSLNQPFYAGGEENVR